MWVRGAKSTISQQVVFARKLFIKVEAGDWYLTEVSKSAYLFPSEAVRTDILLIVNSPLYKLRRGGNMV